MKDWEIRNARWVSADVTKLYKALCLVHTTCELSNRAFLSTDGSWYCKRCGIVAPEEMQFCAELAGCHIYPYIHEGW